jgi:hypothetical protein
METTDEGRTFVTKRTVKKGEELTANYEQYHEYVKVFAERKSTKKR